MLDNRNIVITPQMLTQIAELDEFKGSWAAFARLRPEQLKALKRISTIESIGSSNRIEGNKLSDAEVEELLSHISKKSFKSRDEEEVAGYAELITWTRKNLDDTFYHPLIVIGIFIVHFLSIHPFQDGNGRLSRALTTMLLLKKGYSYVPYSSIESIIEQSKEGYYRALRRTQRTIWTETVDYVPWISFFLTVLQKQKKILEEKTARENRKTTQKTVEKGREKSSVKSREKSSVKSREKSSVKILQLMQKNSSITIPQIAMMLQLTTRAIEKSIKKMQDQNLIRREGPDKGGYWVVIDSNKKTYT